MITSVVSGSQEAPTPGSPLLTSQQPALRNKGCALRAGSTRGAENQASGLPGRNLQGAGSLRDFHKDCTQSTLNEQRPAGQRGRLACFLSLLTIMAQSGPPDTAGQSNFPAAWRELLHTGATTSPLALAQSPISWTSELGPCSGEGWCWLSLHRLGSSQACISSELLE